MDGGTPKRRRINVETNGLATDPLAASPVSLPALRAEVHKFGGSSVADPDALRSVCRIVVTAYRRLKASGEDGGCPLTVVVSAMGKTTDNLIACMDLAVRRQDYGAPLATIRAVHAANIAALVPTEAQAAATKRLEASLEELSLVLHGIHCLKEASARTRARVLSFGERMSAAIVADALRAEVPDTDWCDARALIKTDNNYLSAQVDFPKTNAASRQFFSSRPDTLFVTTGFISSHGEGTEETTVLGRGGSDYTASILGAALASRRVVIWTDVDGVFTADPRKVSDALRIPAMSFQEAMELSFFGAKVIYAPTMGPAMQRNIPLLIKSTFLPDGEGTVITADVVKESGWTVRGITSITGVTLVRLEGCGMVGVAGVSGRLFTALNRAKINVILISQASSEHSICFAVDPASGRAAQRVLAEEFEPEIRTRTIDGIGLQPDCSVLALVGDGMVSAPGVLGRAASALGKHMVNIISVAQGSSERNISLVIPKDAERKALNCLHTAFFGMKTRTIYIFLIGTGRIGAALLDLLAAKAKELETRHSLRVVVAGIANKDAQLSDHRDGVLDDWRRRLKAEGEPANQEAFIRSILETDFGTSMVIDCSNGAGLAPSYEACLRHGIHVISSNRTSLACPLKVYLRLVELAGSAASPTFLFNVALDPVLTVRPALRGLLGANQVSRLQVALPCALAGVFAKMGEGHTFSEAAALPTECGAPDPVEDFTGADYRRRLTLFCRAVGLLLEPGDLRLESFVEDGVAPGALIPALRAHDARLAAALKECQARGQTLRYVGTIDLEGRTAGAGVEAVEAAGPLARSEGLCLLVHTTAPVGPAPPPLILQSVPCSPSHVASALLRDLLGAVGSH